VGQRPTKTCRRACVSRRLAPVMGALLCLAVLDGCAPVRQASTTAPATSPTTTKPTTPTSRTPTATTPAGEPEIVTLPAAATGAVRSGLPTTANLDSVACPSPTECIAVGNFGHILPNLHPPMPLNPTRAVIEHWDGQAWSLMQAAPLAGATGAALLSVACPSIRFCIAVGSWYGKARPCGACIVLTGVATPLAEVWLGGRWALMRLPRLASGQLSGVACVSGELCFAVGPEEVLQWANDSWTTVRLPKMSPPNLTSISCKRNSCMAVGVRLGAGAGPPETPISLYWQGNSWRLAHIPPLPASEPPSSSAWWSLDDVTCPTTSNCFADGSQHLFPGGVQIPLIERWNGRAWHLAAFPGGVSPDGNEDTLESIQALSCATPNYCAAVGSYSALNSCESGATDPCLLVATESDGKWSVLSSNSDIALSDIACSASANCMAVGAGNANQAGTFLTSFHWNGRIWQMLRTPEP
jgi:hypothetical protein